MTRAGIIDRKGLARGFRAAGLVPGDILMVHSSLGSFGRVKGGADAVIDALLDAVGPRGLVSVPTHTWGTVNARQPVFHEGLSHSIVGRITNVFRRRRNAVRSLHPTHSVAAIGKRAREFVRGHERDLTPCSRRSPYGRLVAWGGKVVFLGVGIEYCTLVHGFEEWAPVPWVFAPKKELFFTVRRSGRVIRVPSRRHAEGERLHRDYPSLEPLLREKGALTSARVGSATVRILDARRAAGIVVPLLRRSPDRVLARRGK
jgi:aminoglycoside 3-N-acetyltransferase